MHPFLPIFSDCHSRISVCIKANAKHIKSAQKVNERMPDSFKWNKYSSQRFRKALEDINMQNKIKSFIERKFPHDESCVENACSLVGNFVLQAAGKSLNMRNSNKIKKKSKNWYDEDLYAK